MFSCHQSLWIDYLVMNLKCSINPCGIWWWAGACLLGLCAHVFVCKCERACSAMATAALALRLGRKAGPCDVSHPKCVYKRISVYCDCERAYSVIIHSQSAMRPGHPISNMDRFANGNCFAMVNVKHTLSWQPNIYIYIYTARLPQSLHAILSDKCERECLCLFFFSA